jgi:L-ascorbate metabolism protein UlaG (beta-lactamase superfamily)
MPLPLTWLGHAAFRFDTAAGTRVYVDPFLHGNPRCPQAELEPERCDLVALTHGHDDHVGDTLALAERFGCPVAGLVELVGSLTTRGLAQERALAFNKGGTVAVGDVRLTLTSANHSSSTFQDGRFSYLGEPAGLVVRAEGGPTVYFAGDTNVFGDMQLIGRVYAPDVAVLPIGDHYTMGPDEAAVAVELLGVERVVPSHWGTFPLLTGTPERLAELAPAGVEILRLEPGETVEL